MPEILIIDDEKEICRSLKGLLSDEGYSVSAALTPQEALAYMAHHTPDLVLLDVWFGKSSWDGVHLLDELKQSYPLLPIIMISGHGTLELAVRAIKRGAYDFIEKPFEVGRLLLSIQRALENRQLKAENLGFRQGVSPRYPDWPFSLEGTLKKLAQLDTRLLISGEQGTGKKAFAYEIHKLSSRSHYPFIVLNSAEINTYSPEMLWGVEEEGQVKHPGLLEYAQGGTLVLTHIQVLRRPLQNQFAKILESSTFLRVGGKKPVPLNVRFLATALPLIHEDSARHLFQKDFYDRLTVSTFKTTPVQNRISVITVWIETLLKRGCADLGIPVKKISSDALYALQSYSWPGNIREMRNLLERVLVSTVGKETIDLGDLPAEVAGLFPAISQVLFSLPLQDARCLFEYQYLCAQLAAAEGNISRAAQVIGMERSALHRKLKTLKEKTQSLPKTG